MKPTVSKNRERKQAVVKELSEKIAKAHGVVLTNYQGLTHRQLEELKKGLRDKDAEFSVTKNTLLKLAIANKNLTGTNQTAFENPTGTLFMYSDPISPLKVIAKMIKELKLPQIKFGIVDGQVLDSNQILQLSTLPPKDQLIAQFVAGMKAPLFGIHRALVWNMQKLVMTIKAIEEKRTTASV